MSERTIRLEPGERILAVVPEFVAGPGWANAPTWVYIATQDRRLRVESIQPEERTPRLHTLFALGAQVHQDLIHSVPVRQARAKAAA